MKDTRQNRISIHNLIATCKIEVKRDEKRAGFPRRHHRTPPQDLDLPAWSVHSSHHAPLGVPPDDGDARTEI